MLICGVGHLSYNVVWLFLVRRRDQPPHSTFHALFRAEEGAASTVGIACQAHGRAMLLHRDIQFGGAFPQRVHSEGPMLRLCAARRLHFECVSLNNCADEEMRNWHTTSA